MTMGFLPAATSSGVGRTSTISGGGSRSTSKSRSDTGTHFRPSASSRPGTCTRNPAAVVTKVIASLPPQPPSEAGVGFLSLAQLIVVVIIVIVVVIVAIPQPREARLLPDDDNDGLGVARQHTIALQ